jgi:hypothetical protein
MAHAASRAAALVACLSLALPVAAWAGSAQASLAVSVMVPARCALRVAPLLATGEAQRDGQAVAMKCTRGALPPRDAASARRASAVEPRITREIVPGAASTAPVAPRPIPDHGVARTSADGAPSSLVVTVNF